MDGPRATRNTRLLLLASAGFALAFLALADPIPQDPAYHAFHARCTWLGIPHAELVLTNLIFLWAAWRGSLAIAAARRMQVPWQLLLPWAIATLGVLLTAWGSAWYHLAPSHESLVWDRLPMTIAIAGITAGCINFCLPLAYGLGALLLLLPAGIASVLWWHASELAGRGDLRPYALVHFLPLLVLPMLFMFQRPRAVGISGLMVGGACYVLAKVLEAFDGSLGHKLLLSGHGWKHIVAGIGAAILLGLPTRLRNTPHWPDARAAKPVKVLKRDLFGDITLSELHGEAVALRDIRAARWWARPLATLLFWNEELALAALASANEERFPRLAARARGLLARTWLKGKPLQEAAPPSVAEFVRARELLRTLRRLGITHNDTHKPPNWIVRDDGSLALIDFQLARVHLRRGLWFRTLAREDFRHLLKQQQRFRPGSLSARGQQMLTDKALTARVWRRTVKPVYRLVTRKLLHWQDREGAG